MSSKKAFVLRIDKTVLDSIEKWAADEFRSSNGQLEWIIVNALKKAGRYKSPNNNDESQSDLKEEK